MQTQEGLLSMRTLGWWWACFALPNALFTGPALRRAERPLARSRRAALGPSETER